MRTATSGMMVTCVALHNALRAEASAAGLRCITNAAAKTTWVLGIETALIACALLAGVAAPPAAADGPAAPSRHAMHLVKLPNGDYTVPMSELQGSGTTGKVTLHPQGLKTIVTVYTFGSGRHKHAFNLHTGSDCRTPGMAKNVALAPALTGQPSRTILALPIADLTSHDYVIAAQNATAKAQFQEACARL